MYLKLFTLVLFFAWILYWQLEQYKAYKAKPLTKEKTQLLNVVSGIVIRGLFIFVILQLMGFTILPIHHFLKIYQYCGLVLVVLGLVVSVSARIVLASNWSNAYEYQVKKGQQLISDGIYAYIRHPIYTGMVCMFIGSEMVAGSWLWISFLALFVGAYAQGKREEKILLAYFGNEYQKYMKHTKMLIPFVL